MGQVMTSILLKKVEINKENENVVSGRNVDIVITTI